MIMVTFRRFIGKPVDGFVRWQLRSEETSVTLLIAKAKTCDVALNSPLANHKCTTVQQLPINKL